MKEASDTFNVPGDKADDAPTSWVVQIHHKNKRICSSFPDKCFSRYEFAFKEARMSFPFTGFQVGVLSG